MRLGILTQCHFPSLTWKECTSHNRLHHPAIKPCQGTAFLALPGQLWRERSTQTHSEHRGATSASSAGPATPCSWTWPLTPRIVTGLWCVCHWHSCRASHCAGRWRLPLNRTWADARGFSYYYCYYGRAPVEGGCGVKAIAWCWRRVCFSFFLCLRLLKTQTLYLHS